MVHSKLIVVLICSLSAIIRGSSHAKVAAVLKNADTTNSSQAPYPYDVLVKTASGLQFPTQRWDHKDPKVVTANIYLRSLSHIDPINMEFRVQMTFRQEWLDKKLAYGQNEESNDNLPAFLVVPVDMHGVVWKPDTFFQNEIETRLHDFDKPNRLIRIYPDGRVLMSTRLTTTFSCPMDWRNFPFDTQICSMDFASYAFTTEDILYRWKSDYPIQIKNSLSLAEFMIQSALTDYCTSRTATGEYSCLRASLTLERSIGHHIIHFYAPCIAMVVLSSLVFWLDKSTIRVMVGLSTLIFTGLLASDVNSGLPRVSYLRAMDIWTLACTLFIAFTVIESVIVHYLSRKNVAKCATSENEIIENVKEFPNQNNHDSSKLQYADWSKNSKWRESSKQIDTVCRFAFPVTFLIFLCIYFFAYVR